MFRLNAITLSLNRALATRYVAAALCSYSMGVVAQVAPPAPAATTGAAEGQPLEGTKAVPAQLGVITVTATRRREPLREIPQQVDVIRVEELQNAGAKTLSDYLANDPGVNVKTQGGAGTDSVTIRGVSAGDEIAPLVGIYVDDVGIGSSSAWGVGSRTGFDMGLLDLHHIEVLKGPQGTLYGASSMGGLLKYVTNMPDTSEFSGKVTFGAGKVSGGGSGNTFSGVVNIPLSQDVAAVRLSGFRDQAPGYVDQTGLAPLREANRGVSTGFRLSALIEPTSRFHARLTAMTEDIRRDGQDWVAYGANGKPLEGDFVGHQSVQQPYRLKTSLATADLEYDLGWARLNSISSAQRRQYASVQDLSAYAVFLPGSGITTVAAQANYPLTRNTQELRLTSSSSRTFEWIAGLYYNHESVGYTQNTPAFFAGGSPGPEMAAISLPTMFKETAIYGDVTWKPLLGLSLTSGVRIARNSQDFESTSTGLLVGPAGNHVVNSSSETAKTYLATVSYALTSTSNVYARAASGYRPGGPNTPIFGPGGTSLVPLTFDHDSLWSYEAGYKADLLDKKLAFSASVFDIRWKNIQQIAFVQALNYIANAGAAEIRGAEFATTYTPSADWRLYANMALTDAKITKDSTISVAGNALPNSPKFTASVGAQYKFSAFGHQSYVGISERYVGARHAGFVGSAVAPDYRLPSYAITDIQAGVAFDKAQLAFFVRNALNKRAQLGASSSQFGLGGPWLVQVQQPRTVGANLTVVF
jgi:iron complex outermembrane receptor protein